MGRKHMRRSGVAASFTAVGVLAASVASSPVVANAYYSAVITFVQSPTPSANCLYFQLSGVAQADPVAPNNAWFAVPGTQNGYAQIYATLLSAKLAGQSVSVITTGALAGGTCGNYSGVDHVTLE